MMRDETSQVVILITIVFKSDGVMNNNIMCVISSLVNNIIPVANKL